MFHAKIFHPRPPTRGHILCRKPASHSDNGSTQHYFLSCSFLADKSRTAVSCMCVCVCVCMGGAEVHAHTLNSSILLSAAYLKSPHATKWQHQKHDAKTEILLILEARILPKPSGSLPIRNKLDIQVLRSKGPPCWSRWNRMHLFQNCFTQRPAKCSREAMQAGQGSCSIWCTKVYCLWT